MRAFELYEDRDARPPFPQSPTYSSDWDTKGRKDIGSLVQYIENKGLKPKLEMVPLDKILATQDWLDFEHGGDDPVFDEYDDHPVMFLDKSGYHIIDGHHRSSEAWMLGEKAIKAYVFRL